MFPLTCLDSWQLFFFIFYFFFTFCISVKPMIDTTALTVGVFVYIVWCPGCCDQLCQERRHQDPARHWAVLLHPDRWNAHERWDNENILAYMSPQSCVGEMLPFTLACCKLATRSILCPFYQWSIHIWISPSWFHNWKVCARLPRLITDKT